MKLLFPIFIAVLISCSNEAKPLRHKTEFSSSPEKQKAYKELLEKTASLKNRCKNKDMKQAGILFAQFVNDSIIPYWIGTPWDFNGVTQEPNNGYIACGYFVTTVLRDAGVNINRAKQAQCASEQMINSLTKNKVNYSKISFDDFIKKVKEKGVGMSIIGLDNHTGFLYFDGKELYFIHSSYVGEGKVTSEVAAENSILQNSNYKVVGYISKDESFLRKWME